MFKFKHEKIVFIILLLGKISHLLNEILFNKCVNPSLPRKNK